MTFAPPGLRCESAAPACTPAIGCELGLGHQELHRNGLLVWHDPVQILVGGLEANLTVNTEHWVDGAVVLTDPSEPDL